MTYTCTMTAQEWQLYSYDEYERLEESLTAGRELSKAMTDLVRKAQAELDADPRLSEEKLAYSVRDAMYKLMRRYADLGACDTEPECVLVAELERAFGLDPYTVER